MRFLRQAKNIEILGKKSRFVRNVKFQLVVGQVTSKIDETTRMMKILDMKYDDYLKMYFNKSYEFQVVDKLDESKKGDIVLAKKLDIPVSHSTIYGIAKILFKIDNICDPITNKNISKEAELINEHLKNLQKNKN